MGDGVSAQTKRSLIKDAGFKLEDFIPGRVPTATSSSSEPSQGKTYSPAEMTQEQYGKEIARQKAEQVKAQERARLYNQNKGAASKRLGVSSYGD